MDEFFHGWRRKTGCVTLLMACFVTAIWVRSFDVDQSGYGDYLILGTNFSDCSAIHSRMGVLGFTRPLGDTNDISYYWHVQHWVIAAPLTMLSAYMLISKPKPHE